MTYEPFTEEQLAALRAEQSARIIREAAPLIALALAGAPHQELMQFSFTGTCVVARSIAPAMREASRSLFGYLDNAFEEAGWVCRVSFPGLETAVQVHAYTPGWLAGP